MIGAIDGYSSNAAARAELAATRTFSNGMVMSSRSSVEMFGEIVRPASSQTLKRENKGRIDKMERKNRMRRLSMETLL